MKIIQSFWTVPFLYSSNQQKDNRIDGGWLHRKYYFMSWVLSCLQLLKYYRNVELITDEKGREILIYGLELPYTKVDTSLQALEGYHPDLWALGKVYAYGMQSEPFLHVDSDAFIWERFPQSIEYAPVVVQHEEIGYSFYQSVLQQLETDADFIPEVILEYKKKYHTINAYNMGIAGGQHYAFFQLAADAAFEFIDKNKAQFPKMPLCQFNTFFEQVLFYCMAHERNIKVEKMFLTSNETETDNLARGIDRFKNAPDAAKFIHLYGDCKRDIQYCKELECKILALFPSWHQRIMRLVDQPSLLTTL